MRKEDIESQLCEPRPMTPEEKARIVEEVRTHTLQLIDMPLLGRKDRYLTVKLTSNGRVFSHMGFEVM